MGVRTGDNNMEIPVMDVDVRPYSRGIFKVCPVCNKSFYICEPEIWAYKMNVHTRTDK